jgi:hypothetical protein
MYSIIMPIRNMPASDKHTVTHGDVGNTGVIFIGVMVPEK